MSRARPSVQHGFRYEAMWRRAEDYREVVENVWRAHNVGAHSLQDIWAGLNYVSGALKEWSKMAFGSVRRQIKKTEARLKQLRLSPVNEAVLKEESELEGQLCELFEREEIMARRRARIDWLLEGDHNTAFFHARASARRRTNHILALVREDGSRVSSQVGMMEMVHDFYENLFTAEDCNFMEHVLDAIPSKVDVNMNAELCKPYSNEEIKSALFQMGPTKAPGPDGLPAMFYQVHWDLLHNDICDAVRAFLSGAAIPEGLCDSIIVLIPKVKNAQHLSKFCPISLCNVLYKLASKVLANRLKVFLTDIVSEFQNAFVPGRLITDNVLVAYECLHTIKRQHSKRPFFALKVDMMKAYDRIEWPYLHGCLQKLGFAPEWIQTVMRCVTSARYAVRVNGELTSTVVPSRGIRQGDPLSPFLFLLCTEGLSCLLQKRESLGELQGIKNGMQGPPISHLLFADDIIFFARSDNRSVDALNSALQHYCGASGQKINLQKSSVFFENYCSKNVKEAVKGSLEVHNEILHDTYLGMPTEIGRATTNSFSFLSDRMWKRINGCSDRPMSRAGKEIFLKAVVQAIPNFVMSCFQLPVSICEQMKNTIANHWWGVEDGRKKCIGDHGSGSLLLSSLVGWVSETWCFLTK